MPTAPIIFVHPQQIYPSGPFAGRHLEDWPDMWKRLRFELTDSSPALTTMLGKLVCHNTINPYCVDRIRHHKSAHII